MQYHRQTQQCRGGKLPQQLPSKGQEHRLEELCHCPLGSTPNQLQHRIKLYPLNLGVLSKWYLRVEVPISGTPDSHASV